MPKPETLKLIERMDPEKGNPYRIEKKDGGWCVVKADSGELVKKHLTKSKAVKHWKALEANVKED